jgi:hypothetical protein
MTEEDKEKRKKLIEEMRFHQRQVEKIKDEIASINARCKHEHAFLADVFKEHGKGKKMHGYSCPDCKDYWTKFA